MTATLEQLTILDADIAAAWIDVLDAREAWARSPNAGTIAAEKAAVDDLNDLLELRHKMR